MLTLAIYFLVKLGLLQLYPAYICYKALKVNNQQEFGSLLTFWVVSVSYLAFEYFSDIFLFWIPFYTEIKLVIVLWLILPQTQGASVFYTRYMDPFLHQHEKQIDHTLLEIQATLKQHIILYSKQLIKTMKKMISENVFKGQQQGEQQPIIVEEAVAAEQPSTIGGIINPYSLFSTLIRFNPSTTQQEAAAVPLPVTPTAESTLGRIDSHDSLQSYVNVKSNTTTPELAPAVNQQSWGAYLSSFVYKPTVSADRKDE